MAKCDDVKIKPIGEIFLPDTDDVEKNMRIVKVVMNLLNEGFFVSKIDKLFIVYESTK